MYKFLLRIIKFAITLVLIISFSILFNKLLIKSVGLTKLKKGITTIVLGTSKTVYSINDSKLTHTVNVSHNADALFYSYIKLKTFFKENPNLKEVILGLAPGNISSEMDSRWLASPSYIKSRAPKYVQYFTFEDFGKAFKYNATSYIHGMLLTPKYTIKLLPQLLNNTSSFRSLKIGGYSEEDRDNLSAEIYRFLRHKDSIAFSYEISDWETENLRDIYNFCNENKLKLIFINTPNHKILYESKDYYKSDSCFRLFLNKNYPDIQYLDFSSFSIPDSCFMDLVHLNKYGSDIFTQKLKEIKIVD